MTHTSGARRMTSLEEPLADTLARWSDESLDLDKQGAYDWLCGRIKGDRVLEIGCGFGQSTAALNRQGKTIFALDNRMDCLEATRDVVPGAIYGLADIRQVHELLIKDLLEFAPNTMVLWLAGAPAESLPRDVPEQYAVMQYRLSFQQAAVSLAAQLPSVRTIHLADRTAFPWAMKDAGRQTMAQLITSAVIGQSPFQVTVADVQFRKLLAPASSVRHAMPAGMVPVLGEATLHRNDGTSFNIDSDT